MLLLSESGSMSLPQQRMTQLQLVDACADFCNPLKQHVHVLMLSLIMHVLGVHVGMHSYLVQVVEHGLQRYGCSRTRRKPLVGVVKLCVFTLVPYITQSVSYPCITQSVSYLMRATRPPSKVAVAAKMVSHIWRRQ